MWTIISGVWGGVWPWGLWPGGWSWSAGWGVPAGALWRWPRGWPTAGRRSPPSAASPRQPAPPYLEEGMKNQAAGEERRGRGKWHGRLHLHLITHRELTWVEKDEILPATDNCKMKQDKKQSVIYLYIWYMFDDERGKKPTSFSFWLTNKTNLLGRVHILAEFWTYCMNSAYQHATDSAGNHFVFSIYQPPSYFTSICLLPISTTLVYTVIADDFPKAIKRARKQYYLQV